MIHALLALPSLAAAQIKAPDIRVLNVLEDAGFEKPSLAPAWSDAASYVDPHNLGDKKQNFPLMLKHDAGRSRSGKYGLDFRLTGPNVNQDAHLHAEIAQTLDAPLAVSPLTSGHVYFWSPAGASSPAHVSIVLGYTDGSKRNVEADVSGSQYDQGSTKGWRKVDLKPALAEGRSVARLTMVSDGYPNHHVDLYADDAFLGNPTIVKH